jgi:putative transposase
MARGKRHYIPGQVWHLTHRCHQRELLLKFKRDRQRLLRWLFEAKRRFGLVVLNYVVTSNHIHLIVKDDGETNIIPQSIGLVAGRTAQEYNRRKRRKGAFWEDRYNSTAIETGEHLMRCLVYIDLNMVRAGVVSHPSEWPFGGYVEIQSPRRKNVIISYERLRQLAGFEDYETFASSHRRWVDQAASSVENRRDRRWSESIAVGSKPFVKELKTLLGARANGRTIRDCQDGFELREETAAYNAVLGTKNVNIAPNKSVYSSD